MALRATSKHSVRSESFFFHALFGDQRAAITSYMVIASASRTSCAAACSAARLVAQQVKALTFPRGDQRDALDIAGRPAQSLRSRRYPLQPRAAESQALASAPRILSLYGAKSKLCTPSFGRPALWRSAQRREHHLRRFVAVVAGCGRDDPACRQRERSDPCAPCGALLLPEFLPRAGHFAADFGLVRTGAQPA